MTQRASDSVFYSEEISTISLFLWGSVKAMEVTVSE